MFRIKNVYAQNIQNKQLNCAVFHESHTIVQKNSKNL